MGSFITCGQEDIVSVIRDFRTDPCEAAEGIRLWESGAIRWVGSPSAEHGEVLP